MVMWLQLVVPIVVSALISAGVPRPWLVRAIVAWVVSPALVYWAIVIGELFTRPIANNALGTYLFGFMLIASVVAIPWIVLCLVGFGMGFVIRPRLHPLSNSAAASKIDVPKQSVSIRSAASTRQSENLIRPATAIAALVARSPFVSIERVASWREAHIGFSNSALRLDGLEVWKSKWRDLKLPPVYLPHPAQPQQTHAYDLYEIGPLDSPVRFAAGELSNGVWGFYVPAEPRIESGQSADGAISFIREGVRRLDGRDDSSGWTVLTDTGTGRVLADCKSWGFSQVTSQPDGSLFLHLQAQGFDALMRIAPVSRNFSNLGEAGPNLPLSTLANTLEQTLFAINQHDRVPTYRRISFDGRYRVDLQSVEWSNSHWVNSPCVIENATGLVVLDLWNSAWDTTVTSFEGKLLRLDMRCYGRACLVALELDLAARSFQLTSEGRHGSAELSGNLESLAKALADGFLEDQNEPAAAWPSRREQAAVPPFAAWRSALMILAAAMIAIVLVAVVARNASQPVRRNLDTVPTIEYPRDQLTLLKGE